MDTMIYWATATWGYRSGSALRRGAHAADAVLTAIFDVLLRWQDRIRQRYDLAELRDAALKDIGLSRADVEREVRKPFWRQ
jgi:uncharacterized protein YjiS (DUF1127 family)